MRRLTFDAADDWDPHWSPDGRHLLWSSNRSGHFEIWIAEPDGTGARQLTADGVDAENPTMSADGALGRLLVEQSGGARDLEDPLRRPGRPAAPRRQLHAAGAFGEVGLGLGGRNRLPGGRGR